MSSRLAGGLGRRAFLVTLSRLPRQRMNFTSRQSRHMFDHHKFEQQHMSSFRRGTMRLVYEVVFLILALLTANAYDLRGLFLTAGRFSGAVHLRRLTAISRFNFDLGICRCNFFLITVRLTRL